MTEQPAFPTQNSSRLYAGMTLRDWFAGQALAGLCANSAYDDFLDGAETDYHGLRYPDGDVTGLAQGAAEDAYALADAMMAVRDAKDGRHPQSWKEQDNEQDA